MVSFNWRVNLLAKSERKKKLILEKSREIFMEKGYKVVTMTDVIEACKISRGGLYMYYKNVAEIFFEILCHEQEETEYEFSLAMENGLAGNEIIDRFFKEQKDEILNKKPNLTIATYEFFSMNKQHMEEDILKQQFESAVHILSELIQYGMNRKEFNIVNQHTIARMIVLLLESLRVSSEVMNVTQDLVEDQLDYVRSLLIN